MQNNKYWLHYFVVLQIFSMSSTLYQNLAFGEILGRFGATAQVFGLASFLSMMVIALALPFGGYFVDKIGGTRTFLFSQKISIVMNLLSIPMFYFNANLYCWIGYQIFCALISSVEISSRQHFIFENKPHNPDGVGKGLSTVSFDISLNGFSKILGYSMGAKLLESSHPIWAFMFNALSFSVMAFWVQRNLTRNNLGQEVKKEKKIHKKLPISAVLKSDFLRKILFCEIVFAFCLFSINTQAYLLIKELKVSYSFGWLFVAASTGNFLVNILYTRKYGSKFTFNLILFSITALMGLALLAWHINFWVCLAGVFLTGASLTNFSITTRSQLHDFLNNQDNKGSIFSLFLVVWGLSTALGALIFGLSVQYIGFTNSFTILFSLIFIFLLVFSHTSYSENKMRKINNEENLLEKTITIK